MRQMVASTWRFASTTPLTMTSFKSCSQQRSDRSARFTSATICPDAGSKSARLAEHGVMWDSPRMEGISRGFLSSDQRWIALSRSYGRDKLRLIFGCLGVGSGDVGPESIEYRRHATYAEMQTSMREPETFWMGRRVGMIK